MGLSVEERLDKVVDALSRDFGADEITARIVVCLTILARPRCGVSLVLANHDYLYWAKQGLYIFYIEHYVRSGGDEITKKFESVMKRFNYLNLNFQGLNLDYWSDLEGRIFDNNMTLHALFNKRGRPLKGRKFEPQVTSAEDCVRCRLNVFKNIEGLILFE